MTASALGTGGQRGGKGAALELRKRVEKETCEAVYFLNHNELTESPAETLRTQIDRLQTLKSDLTLLLETPYPTKGLFGSTFKYLICLGIVGAGLGVGMGIKSFVISILIPVLAMVIAAVIFMGWDQLICQETFENQLRHYHTIFYRIRRIMQQARRNGHLRSNREWEVNTHLNSDLSAQSFWRQAFGHDVTRVPILRFEKSLFSALESIAVSLDAERMYKRKAKPKLEGGGRRLRIFRS